MRYLVSLVLTLILIIGTAIPGQLYGQNKKEVSSRIGIFEQEPAHQTTFEKHNKLVRNGMIVLGSWALLNIGIGGVGSYYSSSDPRYFHQGNALWNTVNLAIASGGLWSALNATSPGTAAGVLGEIHNMNNILLFNAGLDVGYMALGAYLWERGIRKDSARFRVYGKAVILQGAFLFGFDLILYSLNKPYAGKLLNALDHVSVSARGVTLSFGIG